MWLGLDIGGTHTRIAWIDDTGIQEVRVHSTQGIPDLEDLLLSCLREQEVKGIGIGVAGIVNNNQHISLHLPWKLNGKKLTKLLKIPIRIVNDVVLLGYAIFHLSQKMKKDTFFPISSEVPQKLTQPWMTLAVGTSLGMSWGIPSHLTATVLPSEIGQSRLFPYTQHDLIQHYIQVYTHPPTVENLISGKGIDRLFALLCEKSPPPWYREDMTPSERSAEIISRDGVDDCCTEVLTIFTELLAELTIDMALHGNACGGIYLAGGTITACKHRLNDALFAQVREAHPYSPIRQFLNKIPIQGILDPYANLWGITSLFAIEEFGGR